MRRAIILATVAAAFVLPGSGAAFHHVVLPANDCGQSPNAGGTIPPATGVANANPPLPPLDMPDNAQGSGPAASQGADSCATPQD